LYVLRRHSNVIRKCTITEGLVGGEEQARVN